MKRIKLLLKKLWYGIRWPAYYTEKLPVNKSSYNSLGNVSNSKNKQNTNIFSTLDHSGFNDQSKRIFRNTVDKDHKKQELLPHEDNEEHVRRLGRELIKIAKKNNIDVPTLEHAVDVVLEAVALSKEQWVLESNLAVIIVFKTKDGQSVLTTHLVAKDVVDNLINQPNTTQWPQPHEIDTSVPLKTQKVARDAGVTRAKHGGSVNLQHANQSTFGKNKTVD